MKNKILALIVSFFLIFCALPSRATVNLYDGFVNQGRMYLVSGSPYADGSSSGNGTLYYGPVVTGTGITLYNGSLEVTQTFSEVSMSLSGLSGMQDIYVYSTGPTSVALSAVAWSGNTPPTRAVQDGRYVKNATPTYLWIGAVYVNSNVTADWTGERWVSNIYNTVVKPFSAQDSTSSWNTATSLGPANGNTTDSIGRISYVQALSIDALSVVATGTYYGQAVTGSTYFAIGLDSTTSPAVESQFRVYTGSGGGNSTLVVNYSFLPSVGWHYIQRQEYWTGSSGNGTGSSLNYLNGTIRE